jgi:hypothetical protein
MKLQTHCIANQINYTRSDWQCMRLYKEYLGLDVNVKNARVRARAEISFGRYNAIPVYGGWNCSRYPRGLSSVGGTNNKGELGG